MCSKQTTIIVKEESAMSKMKHTNGMYLIARKVEKDGIRKLNYYVQTSDHQTYYAFTRKYSDGCYGLCKSGIMIEKLVSKKTKNTAVMRMIQNVKRMWNYLIEYYELDVKTNKKKVA